MDVETASLEINELSNSLYHSRWMLEVSVQNVMKGLLQSFPDELMNRKSESKSEKDNEVRVNPIKMRIR